jgi:hypothetical protein
VLDTRALQLIPPGVNHSIERGLLSRAAAARRFRARLCPRPLLDRHSGRPRSTCKVHRDILERRFPVSIEAAARGAGHVAESAIVERRRGSTARSTSGPAAASRQARRSGRRGADARTSSYVAARASRTRCLWSGVEIGTTPWSKVLYSRTCDAWDDTHASGRARCSARPRACPTTRGRRDRSPASSRPTTSGRSSDAAGRRDRSPASGGLRGLPGRRPIAVGRDARTLSPEIASGSSAGALSQGASVVDIGTVGTDMMYILRRTPRPRRRGDHHRLAQPEAVERHQDGAPWALALSGDAGIKENQAGDPGRPLPTIRSRSANASARRSATITRPHCLSFVEARAHPAPQARARHRHGMGPSARRRSSGGLPLELVKMYFELDGTFPHLRPTRSRRRTAASIGGAREGRARRPGHRLGPATPDRCSSSSTTPASSCRGTSRPRCSWANASAGREPGARVVYDVRRLGAPWPDRVSAAGGQALMHRVGPCLHQEAHARRERGLRRRGLGPLLLPRQLVRRQRHDPGAPDAGADRPRASQALRAAAAAARALLHHGEINSTVRRRGRGALARIEARFADARAHAPRTGCRSTIPTGTSTCGPRTPSRCCA